MNKTTLWSLVIFLVVAVFLISSCAPAAKPATPTIPVTSAKPAAPSAVATPATAAKPATPTASTKPEYGGTITIAKQIFLQMDPYRYEMSSTYIGSFYFEKMAVGNWGVDRNVFDFPSPQGYMPLKYMKGMLAEKWEMPDPLTINVFLRKGVRFHDKPPVNGREFTADDLVWNLERYKASPFVDRMYLDQIASVKKTDKYAVELKLKPPMQLGIEVNILDAAHPLFVARESVGKSGEIEDKRLLIGTGPFMFEELVPNSSVTLKRNPNYWGFDERYPENRLPYADGVKILIIQDYSTWLSAVRTGKIDQLVDVSWQDADSLKKTNPELMFRKYAESNPHVWKMRVDNKPFTDVRVRQAMSMAVDRVKMVKTFYGGYAYPYHGAIKKVHGDLYTPLEKLPDKPMWTTVSVKDVVSYNPQKAKELLAAAGYPNGFKTWIDFTTGRPTAAGLDQIFQQDLAGIGIQADIKVHEWGAFNTLRYGQQHQQIILAWITAYSDETRWFSQAIDPDHQFNQSRTNDPVFNKMYAKMVATADMTERNNLIRQMDMYSHENVFFVSLPEPDLITLWQPWLNGYAGEGNLGSHVQGALFARLWVDQKLKKGK